MFRRSTGSAGIEWSRVAELRAPAGVRRFGASVAVSGTFVAVGSPVTQPEPGALPLQIDVGTVAVFRAGVAGATWRPDLIVRTPAEPGASVAHVAASGGWLAVSGFRREPDGGLVDVLELSESP